MNKQLYSFCIQQTKLFDLKYKKKIKKIAVVVCIKKL